MGQTLTHGVYLPDEGERNCYNGLAANWSILDGAVGTVAEHTTQIAGKAPLVHTHTKSDITDFPAYGTTAGTICEGNDSRLSDARTPVAHTHDKADVTDLLNSNFIPSANNSYDLGSSSYQWNNLYAKNYYYNGVAWGLDKQNEWTNFNRFNGYRLNIKISSQEIGVIPTSNQWNGFQFTDKNNNHTVSFEHAFMGSGETRFKISMVDNYASNSAGSPVWIEFLRLAAYSGGNGFSVGANLTPLGNNLNLGTSTNKWKTLNGVNPGALSLPDGIASNSIAVDITDWYIQDPDYPDDPTKKILDATNHIVKTTVPGWLHIIFPNVSGNWAYARQYAAGVNMDLQRIADGVASNDFANVDFIFPIYSSCYVRIKAKTATVRIFSCLGNV